MADTPNTDQGRENAVAELSSLKEALPLEFAVAAFEKGQNVQKAKADYCDVLSGELSTANEKIADLEKQLSEKPAPAKAPAEGAEPVEHLESGLQPAEGEKNDAQAKFDAFKEANKDLSENEAVVAFAAKHPALIDELTNK